MTTGYMRRIFSLPVLLLTQYLSFGASDVAAGAGEHCSLKPADERGSCYELVMEDTFRHVGTQQALASLQQLVERDRIARRKSHHLAHYIGRLSYASSKTFPEAFLNCTTAFASGCYHGVLEAYLSGIPQLTLADVAAVCRPVLDPVRPAFTHFLCVHGLGHGLTMHFQGDIFKALTYCDGLTDSTEQEHCHQGVFMQNIVTFEPEGNPGHDSHGAHGGHTLPAAHRKHLDPNDELYPCTAVAEKYRRGCYGLQSSGILALNGDNFAKTFAACEKAPAEYVRTCVASIGRDISSFTLNHPEATKAMCAISSLDLVGPCLRGASRDFFYARADARPAIVLCRKAENANKKDCYQGIRDLIIDFYPNEEDRKTVCREADRGYRAFCRGASRWLFWLN